MTRPLLLDLFCGAGGATRGYQDAGFHVLGVDIEPQPNYCGDEFIQYDALAFMDELRGPVGLLVEAIHASPPCPRYSLMTRSNGPTAADKHPDLLPPIRELLQNTGLPYVIENVVGAPMRSPMLLCGEMFGLDVIRHRLFESNVMLMQPPHPPHRGRVSGHRHGRLYVGPYFPVYGTGGAKGSLAEWQRAMGIDWMPAKPEIAQAIPPAYTQFIGEQLMAALEVAA